MPSCELCGSAIEGHLPRCRLQAALSALVLAGVVSMRVWLGLKSIVKMAIPSLPPSTSEDDEKGCHFGR
jgi:hypothetical protein